MNAGQTNATLSDDELKKHQVVVINGGTVNNADRTLDGALMTVHGKIKAKEIEVTLHGYADWWPDYVFDKDYSLTPLQEVEKFINLHKHLPDVPTAKEIEENGLKLGEMNAVLLKKLEELTLYIIELNKKIEELEEGMKALKNNE